MSKIYEKIYQDALKLVKKHASRNPETILLDRGVHLIPFKKNTKLLGMYKPILKNRFVFYNPYISEDMKRMVLAHELGHDIYHQEQAKNMDLAEFTLFDIQSETELEANIFASHLLLDEEELLDYAKIGYTYSQLAKHFQVNINLLIFKLHEMQKRGLEIHLSTNPDPLFFRQLSQVGSKSI